MPQAPLLSHVIAPGEVHIWQARADALTALTREHIRAWALGVLSSYCPGASLTIESPPQGGKPVLKGALMGEVSRDLQFNLSHSGDWVVLGVSLGGSLGVDIQIHRSLRYATVEKLSKRFFAPEEFESLMRLPSDERLAAFYKLWVLKEAVVKAHGQGLSYGLKRFVVTMDGKLLSGDLGAGGACSLGFISLPLVNYSAAFALLHDNANFCPKIIFK